MAAAKQTARYLDFKNAAPHPGQLRVIESFARYPVTVLSPGRQFGKSSTRPFAFIDRISATPGFAFGAYMGPQHADARKAFEEDITNLGALGLVKDKGGDDQDRHIDFNPIIREMPGEPRGTNAGARIYYASGAKDAHRQFQKHKLHFAFIDEFSHVAYPAWFETIQPMFNTTRGHALIVGTPIPDGINFAGFRETFRLGDPKNPKRDPDYNSISGRSEDNPYADVAWIAKQRANLARLGRHSLARCLYDGEFATDEGAVFANLEAVFVLQGRPSRAYTLEYRRPHDGESVVMGLDLGKHKDPTVAAVFSTDTFEMLAVMRLEQMDYSVQLGHIDQMVRDFDRPIIMADAREGGSALIEVLRQRYKERAIGVKWSRGGKWDKGDSVVRGQDLFQTAAVKLIDVEWLREEFRMFSKEELPGGGWRYGAPSGCHDDGVAAVLYAMYQFPLVARAVDTPPSQITAYSPEWWDWITESQQSPRLGAGYSLRRGR